MPERNLRFQQKLWNIVNFCKSGAVSWSNSGDSIIFKFAQFKREYLDRNINFCKSNKVASFVRQLNLYGFRKLVKTNSTKRRFVDEHEFQNMYFRRGRKDLLEYVVRSSATPVPVSRKSRGRAKKVKHELAVKKEDVDYYSQKFFENKTTKISKANKENEFHPVKKRCISNLWDFPKHKLENKKRIISIYKMTNPVPEVARLALRDRSNLCKFERNIQEEPQEPPKPFDYGMMKKELENENVKSKLEEMKPKIFEPKPTEENFSNIDDDDFSRDSEETKDAEDELYKNTKNDDDEGKNYLYEPIVFSERMFSSNNSDNLNRRSIFQKSVEQIELEDAYRRVNGHPRPLYYCVCNPNVPPSWLFTTYGR